MKHPANMLPSQVSNPLVLNKNWDQPEQSHEGKITDWAALQNQGLNKAMISH
jgi:hypothetical protein